MNVFFPFYSYFEKSNYFFYDRFCLPQVIVDGTQYEPAVSSPNKKQAKAEAAQAALKIFGLIT